MDMDLLKVPQVLWRGRMTVGGFALAALILASIYLHMVRYTYTAELIVTPVQGNNSSIAGELGGLAQIASQMKLGVPQGGSYIQFQLYLQGIQSRGAADVLSKRTDLMRVIFAPEWDGATHSWKEPAKPLRPITNVIKAILGVPQYPWVPPNGARLQQYILKQVDVGEIQQKPIWRIALQHRDPRFAVAFLEALHDTVEQSLRQKAINTSAKYITFLTQQLKVVTIEEQRQALINSLNEQEKNMMMASSNTPYAAVSFDRPSASLYPTRPVPLLVLVIALALGILVGCACVLLSVVRPFQIKWPRLPFRQDGDKLL